MFRENSPLTKETQLQLNFIDEVLRPDIALLEDAFNQENPELLPQVFAFHVWLLDETQQKPNDTGHNICEAILTLRDEVSRKLVELGDSDDYPIFNGTVVIAGGHEETYGQAISEIYARYVEQMALDKKTRMPGIVSESRYKSIKLGDSMAIDSRGESRFFEWVMTNLKQGQRLVIVATAPQVARVRMLAHSYGLDDALIVSAEAVKVWHEMKSSQEDANIFTLQKYLKQNPDLLGSYRSSVTAEKVKVIATIPDGGRSLEILARITGSLKQNAMERIHKSKAEES